MAYEQELFPFWTASLEAVLHHNHERPNLYAAVVLFVRAIFTPEDVDSLSPFTRLAPLSFHTPVLPKKDLNVLISTIVRKLQRIQPPLASTHTLRTLELLSSIAPTRLWATMTTTPSFHHTLPRTLFSDILPVSQEELFALQSLQLDRIQKRVGVNRFMIEAHADKIAELPRIIEEMVVTGIRSLIVIDDELDQLAQIDALLSPVYDFPVHLIYVNPASLSPSLPPYISSSLIHYFYTVSSFDEIPRLLEEEITSIHPTILCDFEGVITNLEDTRQVRWSIVQAEVLGVLSGKSTYAITHRRNKPRLAPI